MYLGYSIFLALCTCKYQMKEALTRYSNIRGNINLSYNDILHRIMRVGKTNSLHCHCSFDCHCCILMWGRNAVLFRRWCGRLVKLALCLMQGITHCSHSAATADSTCSTRTWAAYRSPSLTRMDPYRVRSACPLPMSRFSTLVVGFYMDLCGLAMETDR